MTRGRTFNIDFVIKSFLLLEIIDENAVNDNFKFKVGTKLVKKALYVHTKPKLEGNFLS